MTAAAAIAFCGTFTSCTHDDITVGNGKIDVVDNYETAFITRFGTPADTQTWGFGKAVAAGTRSASSPSVPDIAAPFSDAWVASYNSTATEPTSANVTNNDSGTTMSMSVTPVMPEFNYGDILNKCVYNPTQTTQANVDFYNSTVKSALEEYYAAPQEYNSYNNEANYVRINNAKIQLFLDLCNAITDSNRTLSDWIVIYTDPVLGVLSTGDYVTNFKITGTWDGDINVVATEGYTDGVANGNERTVVVTGKWNLTANQRVGAKGRIIVADGGEIAISEGKTLEMVNESRLVVLQGGKITGKGNIKVTNGTADGMENYNGGEIDIEGYFNNNFGKFYNYGKFKCYQYQAGGQESSFYNHGQVHINNAGTHSSYVDPNARIYNACQWICDNGMRVYILEMTQGSFFYVGGELMAYGGNDGTDDPSYISLASGAYMQIGSLHNGSSWYGPTDGGAVVEIGQVTHCNYEDDESAGFFHNNIYLSIDDQTNSFTSGKLTGVVANSFWKVVGKYITQVTRGEAPISWGDDDFVWGESGCTPGYNGNTRSDDTPAPVKIIAEDLSVDENGDFDFNDVVFLVDWVSETEAQITLQKAGGTLPLVVGVAAGQEETDGEFHANEVHKRFNVSTGTMVNIGSMGVVRDEVIFNVSGTFTKDTFAADCNNIRVAVKKSGEWHELTAVRGKVPSKIAVAKRFVPCEERRDIEDAYPDFPDWVQNPSIVWY